MKSDLVSIVIPVYNMAASLEACLDTLLAQTCRNTEILLVDDGSTDNSWEVCRAQAQRDPRIRVFHTENQGPGPARNYGMAQAKGRYLCFADADDFYRPDAVQLLYDAMRQGGCDMAVAGFSVVNGEGTVRREKIYPDEIIDGEALRRGFDRFAQSDMRYGIHTAPWCKLFDLDLIRRHGLQFPPLRKDEDTAFIYEYLCHVRRVRFLPDAIYTYHESGQQKTWAKYSAGYLESVLGLQKVVEETVLTWAPENRETRELMAEGYVSNLIRAMETLFAPNVPATERLPRLKEIAERGKIQDLPPNPRYGRYRCRVLQKLQAGDYAGALAVLRARVWTERYGLAKPIGRALRLLKRR